ncbi:hypothetical protein Tco_0608596 [Tanacetum coccineum]
MASMNTRLNIEKLDGNIVQKHGGSKQVGFKQLGPDVEQEEESQWWVIHEAEVFRIVTIEYLQWRHKTVGGQATLREEKEHRLAMVYIPKGMKSGSPNIRVYAGIQQAE